VGPGNHVLDGVKIPMGRGNFGRLFGRFAGLGKRVISRKAAELIEVPFWGLTHVSTRKSVLDGVQIGQIHSHPRQLTSRRCGLLPRNYHGRFFIFITRKAFIRGHTDDFAADVAYRTYIYQSRSLFPPCCWIWFSILPCMILTCALDLNGFNLNHHANYLD